MCIKDLLSFHDQDMTFYEQLFIAVKLHRILNKIENDHAAKA